MSFKKGDTPRWVLERERVILEHFRTIERRLLKVAKNQYARTQYMAFPFHVPLDQDQFFGTFPIDEAIYSTEEQRFVWIECCFERWNLNTGKPLRNPVSHIRKIMLERDLKKELRDALAEEDYERAAVLRDMM